MTAMAGARTFTFWIFIAAELYRAACDYDAQSLAWLASSPQPLLQLENLYSPEAFERVTGYTYTLPEALLLAGVHLGPDRRMHRFLMKWLSGKQVNIGIVGGSVAAGRFASSIGETDMFSLVAKFFQKAHPAGKVHARNGAVPATMSSYMELCLPMHMDAEADFMLVDYAVNDVMHPMTTLANSSARVYEQLLRKILDSAHKPAVMPIMFLRGAVKQGTNIVEWPYYATAEDRYQTVATYYGLTTTSARSALYGMMTANVSGYTRDELFQDGQVHPNDLGMKLYADLVVYAVQRSLQSLAHEVERSGLFPAAQSALSPPPPLQLPIIPGNMHTRTLRCMSHRELGALAVEMQGFKWGYDGKLGEFAFAKYGFSAEEVGSHVVLEINTDNDDFNPRGEDDEREEEEAMAGFGSGANPRSSLENVPGPGASNMSVLHLGYLKSYEHMGVARVECISGCTCKPQDVDAHHTAHNSQTFVTRIEITKHRHCHIQISVLSETSSGEHRFKVNTLAVSEWGAAEDDTGALLRRRALPEQPRGLGQMRSRRPFLD